MLVNIIIYGCFQSRLMLDQSSISHSAFLMILFCLSLPFLFQDGRIDYSEFVAMMQKGNADIGRRGHKRSGSGFSVGFREALSVC